MVRSGFWWLSGGQVFVGRHRFRRATAALAEGSDLEDPNATVERQGHHVTKAQRVPWRPYALAVEADMAGSDKRSSIGPGSHGACMPEPFIDTLVLFPFRHAHAYYGCSLPSSCCLSAASLAKGEFGSGALSRAPEPEPCGLA